MVPAGYTSRTCVDVRTAEVQRHGLEHYPVGVFQKPIQDFETGLRTFGVTARPDFVIDDYPEIVGAFGGVVVRPYYFAAADDDEMEKVYRIFIEYSAKGHSPDAAFRPGRNGLNRMPG